MSRVVLKKGREASLLRRHPWIFSGAIHDMPLCQPGDILTVYTYDGKQIASAYFHPKNSIAGRILSFGEENALTAFARHLQEACDLRTRPACRLINAEGDFLPGLIVDKYNDVLVIQISTYGMERLKEHILSFLIEHFKPRMIYEKSVSAARREEGLKDFEGVIYGETIPEVMIEENGATHIVPIIEGQKTGFFLDQREMRYKIQTLSKGKRVLNCFAYTGGFGRAALHGGAAHIDNVEISKEICKLADKHNPDPSKFHYHCDDVFDFLQKKPLNYDIVILDPPAFVKKKADLHAACGAYKELNRLVMAKAPAGTLLLTSSCSSYMEAPLFQNIIAQAGAEAGKNIRILGKHLHADDHPISLYHPEGDYLKSLLLYLTK
ncbi:MAG: class I SAM-dependent rRNA methyltransferase [Verrucomicrobia bacterium]|nr:class I SAM-dependent rRNA methyltransferase [Verrucomicrobiota bacterium]